MSEPYEDALDSEVHMESKIEKNTSRDLTTKKQIISELQRGLPDVREGVCIQPGATSEENSLKARTREALGTALSNWFKSPTEGERYSIVRVPGIEESLAATLIRALKPIEECFRWRFVRNRHGESMGCLEMILHNGIGIQTWRLFWEAVFRK
mmetsp:Transcript_32381/g.78796  ORF Transcript_32381/g.78796 Transcript_32381/m.78796 type:complete len:153 (+) Transcript_32381:558-1016(+)